MKPFDHLLISKNSKLIDAISTIEKGGMQIALVVDQDRKLLGTITDGDFRRGILKGFSLEHPVVEIMNKSPFYVKNHFSQEQILNLMKTKSISQVPVIDHNGIIVRVETLSDLLSKDSHENFVILMAGGMGKRLGSLTEAIPKPLLKVGNKPILEIILDNFISQGFKNFYISVNYKADMIKEYFRDGSHIGVNIQYLEEQDSLGTAGALTLLPQKSTLPLIVMNGDLLTKVNFKNLLEFHQDQKAMATMCVREYDFQVPYGVVGIEGESIKAIDEKPIHKFFVNAGIYVIEPSMVEFIPSQLRYDMPTLFNMLKASNKKTTAFPILEYWLDIGKKDDFEKANHDFTKGL